MELNEREVVRILKQGAEAEQEFSKRRESILKEREYLMREASEWEKLDCEAADRLRRSVTGEDSLTLLLREECLFHAVREALWRIDPASRDLLKEYYGKNGFAYAYRVPGMNKVLQAAGRVIRTMEDTGWILLLDGRFLHEEYQGCFPPSWNDREICTLRDAGDKIREFWLTILT